MMTNGFRKQQLIEAANLLLNARRFAPDGDDAEGILLAIEDDSDHSRAEAAMKEGG